jgi:hypothetical protein
MNFSQEFFLDARTGIQIEQEELIHNNYFTSEKNYFEILAFIAETKAFDHAALLI